MLVTHSDHTVGGSGGGHGGGGGAGEVGITKRRRRFRAQQAMTTTMIDSPSTRTPIIGQRIMRSVQSSALKDPKVDVLVDVVAVVSVLLEVVKLDVVSVMLNVELVLTVPLLLCELLLVLETVTEVLEVEVPVLV